MRNLTFFVFIGAAVVLAALIAWYALTPKQGSMGNQISASTSTFSSSAYDYTFTYPQNFEARQMAPEYVVVGDTENGAFAPKASIAVLHAGITEPLPSYDDFVRLTVQLACQMQTGDCTYSSKSPYTNANGLSGEEWYFMRGGEKRGPFYTFNISANLTKDKYGVLVVYPPSEVPMSSVDTSVITHIADSVHINKTTTR